MFFVGHTTDTPILLWDTQDTSEKKFGLHTSVNTARVSLSVLKAQIVLKADQTKNKNTGSHVF